MAPTGTDDAVTFVISVAAELSGMHPQTLRQYDRLGLVSPARTKGRGRRYTKRDVQRLRDVQRMSQEEGINLAGMHPQTLRQYDRLGLVIPARTKGRGRRYTKRDVQRLRDVQRMSQEEGINLAGIRRILELERRVEALEEERDALRGAVAAAEAKRNRVFAASADGQVMPMRRGQRPWDSSSRSEARSGGSLTVWNPVRALAALASSEAPARSALPAAPRSKARAVIEGTIVSHR